MLHAKFITLGVVLDIFFNGAALIVHSLAYNASSPVVKTRLGSIRGLRADDGNYSMFMGIPYAKVDKNNIFGPAVPYSKFESIFNASDDSARCPQIEEFYNNIVGSLDCLHLNIYVPNSASIENRLPVFVWIYGGDFRLGFAGRFLYGPKFIVRHDVIVVTFNYRIGLYGFMCLDIPEVSGNQGLKDQVLALRWIKKNINAFGGDPQRITLAGNSVGGACVDIHLHYLKENLFHKAILQSIYPPVRDGLKKSNVSQPITVARLLNYNATDLRDALSFLSTVDTHKVVAATADLNFGPCIEKFNNSDNYITQHPLNVDKLRVKDIDILIGFNDNELYSFIWLAMKLNYLFIDLIQWIIQNDFDVGADVEVMAEMTNVVRRNYFGDKSAPSQALKYLELTADMASNFGIHYKTLKTVETYLENEVKSLYLYLFSYCGGRNFAKHWTNLTVGGAIHADEIGYLFDISYMEKPLDPADQLIVERMTELWTNFIKNGNPTPEPTELVPVLWPKVTREKYYYLELDSEIHIDSSPLSDRMAFLDWFYLKYGQYYKQRQPDLWKKQHFTNIGLLAGNMVELILCLLIIFNRGR